jgi:hypothetical protein
MSNNDDISLDLGIIFTTLGLALLTASGTRGSLLAQTIEDMPKKELQEVLVEYVSEILAKKYPEMS